MTLDELERDCISGNTVSLASVMRIIPGLIAVARAAQKAVDSDSDRDFYALREALKELP